MQSSAETPVREDRVNTDGGVAPDADKAAEHTPTSHAQKKREDELQDEALEETFPASDPPSAKHFT